jgi:hypothetical protein
MERKNNKKDVQLTIQCKIAESTTSIFLNTSMIGMEFHCMEDQFNASFGCNCNYVGI